MNMVSVIIANWNGKQYLKTCLDALCEQTFKDFRVTIVDNGSTDGSIEFVRENYPEVEIVALDRNYGFAKANNIAMQKALSEETEYIALLNNDTKADTFWLDELVKTMDADNRVGMCASKLLKMDNPEILDSAGHILVNGLVYDRGGNEPDRGQYDKKVDIFGACAAACLYRKDMLEEIGLFDESYGSYYEDAELSWRAYKVGWKAKFVPRSVVFHVGYGTTKDDTKHSEQIRKQSTLNIVKTIQRHATVKQKICLTVIWFKEAMRQRIKLLFLGKQIELDYIERLKLLWFRKEYSNNKNIKHK